MINHGILMETWATTHMGFWPTPMDRRGIVATFRHKAKQTWLSPLICS